MASTDADAAARFVDLLNQASLKANDSGEQQHAPVNASSSPKQNPTSATAPGSAARRPASARAAGIGSSSTPSRSLHEPSPSAGLVKDASSRLLAWGAKRDKKIEAERKKMEEERAKQEDCTFAPNLSPVSMVRLRCVCVLLRQKKTQRMEES
jgi:hypothetical protein